MRVRTGKDGRAFELRQILVEQIRPEDGLGRQRDREGHRELCRSIETFGVLTPITVRRASDNPKEFLLIKGQGRTLACRLLGIATVPAVVVDDHFADTEKVQQFLAENVARLRMRPIDRALLISRARKQGEETTEVAERFGVSYSTVRRLEAQLDGATSGEVRALRANDLTLSLHAVIARRVPSSERAQVIDAVGPSGIKANELDALLDALGWEELIALGARHRRQRVQLVGWACHCVTSLPKTPLIDRIRKMAMQLPMQLATIEDLRAAQ